MVFFKICGIALRRVNINLSLILKPNAIHSIVLVCVRDYWRFISLRCMRQAASLHLLHWQHFHLTTQHNRQSFLALFMRTLFSLLRRSAIINSAGFVA